MSAESTIYKRNAAAGRAVRKNLAAKVASEAIGEIESGCEIFGLNKGKFSLIDIIAHCLEATGPADVTISTWTAAGADMGFAYDLMRRGEIRSLRMIVDFSFPTRQPEYCAALRERFGDSCLRVTKTHAKFVLIRNSAWNIVVRSSMNLNENRRLESFEISDHAGMADFLEQVIDQLFASQADGKGFENRPYDNVVEFEKFGEDEQPSIDEVAAMSSTDAKKYFGAGRYATDIRRSGVLRQ